MEKQLKADLIFPTEADRFNGLVLIYFNLIGSCYISSSSRYARFLSWGEYDKSGI